MGYRLSPDQLEAIRPYATLLEEQGPGEGSSSSDGAVTLIEGKDFFPGASAVHIWKFTNWLGSKFIIDIVGKNGKVQTVQLKPRVALAK